MNEFKGTPGPWQTTKPKVKQNGLFVEIDIMNANSAVRICTVKKDIGFTSAEDVERNAQLISKAPELLAKLQSILNMSEDVGRAGCTWGDTNMSSTDVAFGYNTALEDVKIGIEKLIKEATSI